MAINIRDVQRAQKEQLDQREPKRDIVVGRIVSVNGSTSPNNRPNYVYFLEFNQNENGPPAIVFNDVVAPIANLPVIVGPNPAKNFGRKVLGVYSEATLITNPVNVGAANVPLHGATHEYQSETNAGHDKVRVFQPAIQPLKTIASTNLTVTVMPAVYHYYNRRYSNPGGSIDLTSYIPAVGNVKKVLIYLDQVGNTLEVADGVEIVDTGIVVPPYPDFPVDSIPSAYITLYSTTTAIPYTLIEDARAIVNSFSSFGNLTPRRVGDFLVSLDGFTFEAQEPLVDSNGNVIMDSNGHFVTI